MTIEPLYSDAHPYYVDEDDTATTLLGTGVGSAAKGVPTTADASGRAETSITQAYMQKALFFIVLVAVALYLVKRSRSGYNKLDEKSLA